MVAHIRRFSIPTLLIATLIVFLILRLPKPGASDTAIRFQDVELFRPPSKVQQNIAFVPSLKEVHNTATQNHETIFNTTLGFQKVFAINLPSRTDKRDALALSSRVLGFDVEFVDGVDPSTISKKARPQKITAGKALKGGILGCWRAHMNTIARVVQEGLNTALVLEDDVDFDVRLLTQLQEFAIMSNAVLDNTDGDVVEMHFDKIDTTSHVLPSVISPYGKGWDVLLLGNCGVDVDRNKPHVARSKDQTVPDLVNLHIYGDEANLRLNPYSSHTRVVGYAIEQTCTYAYAVSQEAARQLLLDLGGNRLDDPFDIELRNWCEGKYPKQGPPRKCIGVLPTLFDSYKPAGPTNRDSDIDGDKYHEVFREKAITPNIQRPVRMNLRKLLAGDFNIGDQFPKFTFGTRRPAPLPDSHTT